MNKVWIVLQNRLRISLNKLLYGTEINKKDTSRLWMVLAVAIFVALILFGLSMLATYVGLAILSAFLEKITSEQQHTWLTLLCFSTFLSIFAQNMKNGIMRFVHTHDMDVMLAAPIHTRALIITKFYERSFIKAILFLVGLMAPLAINFVLLLQLDIMTLLVGMLTMAGIFILGHVLRLNVLSLTIRSKISKKSTIGYNTLLMCTYICNTLAFIYLLFPFVHVVDNQHVQQAYNFLLHMPIVQGFVQVIVTIPGPHTWTTNAILSTYHHQYVDALVSVICLAALLAVSLWGINRTLQDFERHNLLGMVYVYAQPTQIKRYDRVIGMLEALLTWLHPHTRTILLKDFQNFLRDRRLHWLPIFTLVLLGFSTTVGVFHFVFSQIPDFPIPPDKIGLFLCLLGCNILVAALMDRFSIDVEGNNFVNLIMSPISSKRIIVAKMVGMLIAAIPCALIMSSIVSVVFGSNLLLILLCLATVIPTFIIAALTATSTFPNFAYESLLDLPTIKAKILMNILSSCYITVSGGILYIVPSQLLGMLMVGVLGLVASRFLFQVCCQKVVESQGESHFSMSEIWD